MQNIVLQATVYQRVQTLRWFINLAEELLQVNDVSSALAIQGGLTSTEVDRLTRTWKVKEYTSKHIGFKSLMDLKNRD